MSTYYQQLITKAYDAFNARNIDEVFTTMQPDVHWPNGWEGGYVEGYDEVREYWTRQWKELNPVVLPIAFTQKDDGRIETDVQQTVKDMQGNTVFNGIVKHIYTITGGVISSMEIEKAE